MSDLTTFLSATLGVHGLALFAATIVVLNATPGVDLMLTFTTTLRQGVRAGLAVAAGISAGCVVHTLGAAFGLAALMAASATAFTAVKWAGAAYLLWLAVGMWREAWQGLRGAGSRAGATDGAMSGTAPGSSPFVADGPAPARARGGLAAALFRRGLLTNVLNPKVAIFFLALLPQFIDAGAVHKTLAFLFLGTWFILQSFVFLAVFVALVAPLRRWQPGARVRAALLAAGGSLFALLAGRLALAARE